MLLVGATRNFIRIPHFIEGTLQGAIAGGLAFLVVNILQNRMAAALRFEAGIQLPIELLSPAMATWFMVGGVTLGFLGSALALSRYLKVTQ